MGAWRFEMADRDVRLKTPDSYRDTDVPVLRSQANIESVLRQFGAEATAVSTVRRGDEAIGEVAFVHGGQTYRLRLAMGDKPQEHRQRMRVLFWYVKATLEAVTFGVVSLREAMLPYAEIADGYGGRTTVGKVLTAGHVQLPAGEPDGLLAAIGVKALIAGRGA